MKIATEGAMWGSITDHGLLTDAVIVSDGAGQFNVGHHARCWVHAERLIHSLIGFTAAQRAALERIRARVWWFYADLKTYGRDPTPDAKRALSRRFDRIFTARTEFVTLDRLLARLHANKDELLVALERPDIPLHTNGSDLLGERYPLPSYKTQDLGRHTLRCRARLPRWIPRFDEDLRQARRPFLGLPRQPPQGARRSLYPSLARSYSTTRRYLSARAFAPVTASCWFVAALLLVWLQKISSRIFSQLLLHILQL